MNVILLMSDIVWIYSSIVCFERLWFLCFRRVYRYLNIEMRVIIELYWVDNFSEVSYL